MQVYDTAHLLFQACVIKLVVKIQVRALLPCCDKTTKVDDMAHHDVGGEGGREGRGRYSGL